HGLDGGGDLRLRVRRGGGDVRSLAGASDHVAQVHRYWEELLVTEVQKRLEPGVPVRDGVEEEHRRNDRLGKRQHHAQQDPVGGETVDRGGLLELHRQILKESLHDQEIEDAHRIRDYDGPHRIHYPQGVDENVVGDDSAVEEHCKHGDSDEQPTAT